jgi:hypothetical protein
VRLDYDFTEPSFRSVPLRDPLSEPALQRLLATLLQGRLIPLVGAGLSAGSPTDAPQASVVADRLVEFARNAGLQEQIDALEDQRDLGEVAAVLRDALGRGTLERELLAVNWAGRPFNLGHLAIALMYGEGLVSVGFTTNWDPLIARAADTIADLRLWCPCDIASLRTSGQPLLVHLHGDADHPTSLVATRAELDEPDAVLWTQPQLAAALARGELMLVGFGVEPEYIMKTLEAVVGVVGDPPAAVINRQPQADFVARSPRLAAASEIDGSSTNYVEGPATDCLAEALRMLYFALVRKVLDDAGERGRAVFKGRLTQEGIERVTTAVLNGSLADLLGMLWTAAYLPSGRATTRQPTVRSLHHDLAAAITVVMVLASAKDVADLGRTDTGMRLLTVGGPVDLWIVLPEERMTTTAAARGGMAQSSRLSKLSDGDVPLVMIFARTDGAAPGGGHANLVGTQPAGALTGGMRQPADLLTLEGLSSRADRLDGDAPSSLRDLLRLP